MLKAHELLASSEDLRHKEGVHRQANTIPPPDLRGVRAGVGYSAGSRCCSTCAAAVGAGGARFVSLRGGSGGGAGGRVAGAMGMVKVAPRMPAPVFTALMRPSAA